MAIFLKKTIKKLYLKTLNIIPFSTIMTKSSFLERDESDLFANEKLKYILNRRDEVPKISAVYRVKNASTFLEISVLSVAPIVSEIIIVDNGSSDNTISIANDLKCSLEHICNVKIYSYNTKLSIAGENYKKDIIKDPDSSLAKYYNYSFDKANLEYVMKVDAHCVFLPKHLELIQNKLSLNPRFIRYRGIESFGKFLNMENYIFKNKDFRFEDRERYEILAFDFRPSYFEIIKNSIFSPVFIHMKRITYLKFLYANSSSIKELYK